MKTFALPEQLGSAVINYLAQRPYAEVATMIVGLFQLKEVPPVPLALVPKENEVE